MGFTKARRATLVAAFFALLLALALPASAYAATFANEYPLGVLHTQPQVVGVAVFGSSAFDARTAKITIGGVAYKTYTSQTSSGHWVYSETGPDANGLYKVRWTWVSDPAQPNQVVMYCYPAGAAVSDGNPAVVATIKDVRGATWTDTWAYAVRIPPVFGTPTPAAGSIVTTLTPTISIPVTDNGPGSCTATATVGGIPAAASVAGGVVRVASPVLANDAVTTVVVTASDASGNKTTKAWSFSVEIYPDMSSTLVQCASCHPGFENDNDMGPDCVPCHDALGRPHQGTPVSLHTKADVAACSPCHVSDITVEHARWTSKAGTAMTCLTCHTSTDPNVVAAIATGASACAACHADVSHTGMHATTVSPSCTGSACHSGTNLTTIHINSGTTSTCKTCHESADPNVVNAIATHDKSCTACHSASSPHGDNSATHQASPASETITISGVSFGTHACSECHAPTNLLDLHGNACATCHPTPAASAKPWAKGCVQGGCHTLLSTAPMHASIDAFHAIPADKAACFAAGCHTGGTSLAAIHANKQGCATCHGAGKTPTSDCSASGCHDLGSPHGDNSATHQASPASQTITISGVSFGTHACSECHAPTNLLDLHGNACATCHPTPAASAKPWAKGCVQGGCHTLLSTAPMHASIDAFHAIPADKAACLASGCHDAGAIVPFVGKSVAELHASASTSTPGGTRASCQICHAPGVTPTADCLTSGCHPDRADFHGYTAAVHTGNPTSSTFTISGATYPAIACASCHSTELGVEHTKPTSAGNTGCTECHSGLVAQLPPPWVRTTCAQGNCHAGTSSDPLHGAISTAHARLSANDACFAGGCHAAGNLASIHAEATGTVAGQERTSCMLCHAQGVPTSADCTTCHPDKVASHYDALLHTATLTSGDMTILGVDYGTHSCSDCHPSAELGVIHTSGCATCHPTPAASAKPWDKSCATGGCHTAGSTKPMHGALDAAHVRPAQPAAADGCFAAGCHTGGTSLAAIHANKQGCATCHGAGKTPTSDCSASGCHDLGSPHANLATAHTSSGGSEFVSAGMQNDIHDLGYGVNGWSCSDCHTASLIPLHVNYCGACHAGSARDAVKNAVASGTTDCTACHPSQHAGPNATHEIIYGSGGCDCHNVDPYSDPTDLSCTGCHLPPTPVPNPTTTSDAKPAYVNDAKINLFPSDNVQGSFGIKATYYVLDGASAAIGTLVTVPAPASGTQSHTLKFWSTDWSGNSETTKTITFTVQHDSYPPVTTSDIVSGSTYTGSRAFTLTAVDADSYVAGTWWQLDGTAGTWTSGTVVPVTAPPSGTASHVLYWYSRDGWGNTETVKSVPFSIVAGKAFSFTGADQTFVVPSGITSIAVTMYGGSGGNAIVSGTIWGAGGAGGRVVAVIPVVAGSTLTMRVGGAGGSSPAGVGGWPNGGRGNAFFAGGGGGSSSVWRGSTELVEAGAGGGGGRSLTIGAGGAGGSQGTLPGGYRTGGDAVNSGAGGGAGGWNAGSAGASGNRGGTGGTSYIASGTGTLTSGVRSGNGAVTITY